MVILLTLIPGHNIASHVLLLARYINPSPWTIHIEDDYISWTGDQLNQVKRSMAKSSMLNLALAFAIAGILLSTARAQDDCSRDLEALKEQCRAYVGKEGPPVPPSVQCCHAVKHADIPCVCDYVTPEVEEMVSMEKVVYVAERCGQPLKHGRKCGSYIVPMA